MVELPRIRKESGVFWVEVEKLKPNSMQPRRAFDEEGLKELAESIRQYGVLQPLVVVRQEKEVPTGAVVEYEIIAGERRWRASKLAGLTQVPVIIREEPSEKIKLELALIENLQREDLNALERAAAFKQLVDEFKMRHHEVGSRVGKSREYVSNSIRLLSLPQEIQEGLRQGLINEGHTRPLLSLSNTPEEQINLYREIVYRKMNVREAEAASRRLLRERSLKRIRRAEEKEKDPETQRLQQQLSDILGTRVSVEPKGKGKRVSIEFFSDEDLMSFLSKIKPTSSYSSQAANQFEEKEVVSSENLEQKLPPEEPEEEILKLSDKITTEEEIAKGKEIIAAQEAEAEEAAVEEKKQQKPWWLRFSI